MQICTTDIADPVFEGECPKEVSLTVAPCQNSTTLVVTKPVATDNSGNVTVFGPDNMVMELAAGVHTLSYAAEDPASNYAYCNITVTVNCKYERRSFVNTLTP